MQHKTGMGMSSRTSCKQDTMIGCGTGDGQVALPHGTSVHTIGI